MFRIKTWLRRMWGLSFGADPYQVLPNHTWRSGEAEALLEEIHDLPEFDPYELT